jgi:hypothetical protein
VRERRRPSLHWLCPMAVGEGRGEGTESKGAEAPRSPLRGRRPGRALHAPTINSHSYDSPSTPCSPFLPPASQALRVTISSPSLAPWQSRHTLDVALAPRWPPVSSARPRPDKPWSSRWASLRLNSAFTATYRAELRLAAFKYKPKEATDDISEWVAHRIGNLVKYILSETLNSMCGSSSPTRYGSAAAGMTEKVNSSSFSI